MPRLGVIGALSGTAADALDARISSTGGSSWVTSWRLSPVSAVVRGMPPASVMTWCFEPGLRRSTKLGPVLGHP